MNRQLIQVVQKIERLTQMQWAEREYLEGGHSIYHVWSTEDADGLLFHGTYTDYNTLPDDIAALNGCDLLDVAHHLHRTGRISDGEWENVKHLRWRLEK